MHIQPFKTEQYFSQYEFSAEYPLSVSDCETVSVAELLQMAGSSLEELGNVRLNYTESQGDPELRQAISEMYESVSADEVVFLTTPVEGIYLLMRTLLNAGDKVVALRPAYDALNNLVEHICGQFIPCDLKATDHRWELDFDELESLVTEDTRLIVVNFPHNPTGFQPTVDQFARLLDIAAKYGTWLFCDEMYRGLELGDSEQIPSAVDVYDRSIVLSGLSKTYGLPGLRSGWLVVKDRELRDSLINWKHYTTICPVATTEFLSKKALMVREQLREKSLALIESNLEDAEAFFARWPDHFVWRRPVAGSVGLVELNLAKLDHQNVNDYCHHLVREHGVMLLPGVCLGCSGPFVRFGFGRDSFGGALKAYERVLSV